MIKVSGKLLDVFSGTYDEEKNGVKTGQRKPYYNLSVRLEGELTKIKIDSRSIGDIEKVKALLDKEVLISLSCQDSEVRVVSVSAAK